MRDSSYVRRAVLCLLVGSFGLKGCSCPGGTVTTGEITLEFTFPEDGATLTSQDDVNPTLTGIQVNVRAAAEGLNDGAILTLTNDHDIDGSGVPIATSGTVSDEEVIFNGYTLPEGELVLRIARADVALDEECTQRNCHTIAVTVVENICLFNTPVDGDVLTEDAYPDAADPFDPFETDVVLDCRGVDAGEFVALVVDEAAPLIATMDDTGRVTFPRVRLAEGLNSLSALSRTDAQGENPQGAASTATVNVSTGRCIVRARPADSSRILAEDDLQTGLPGMQTMLDVITSCADTSTVSMYVKGPLDTTYVLITPPEAPVIEPDSAGTRFRFNRFPLPESAAPFDVELIAVVTESVTVSGPSLPNRYWVDSTRPVFEQAVPSDNACVSPALDIDSGRLGIQILVSGTVTGSAADSEVWARVATAGALPCTVDTDCEVPGATTQPLCRQTACRYVGAIDANGDYAISGVDVPNGNITLEYIATDEAGNLSIPELAEVFAFETPPQVTVTFPVDATTLGANDDASSTDPGLQIDVQLDLRDIGAGSLGTLIISGQSPVPFPPLAGDSTPLVRATLQDGPRTLTARVTDFCGNVIQDSIDVTVSSIPVSLAVNAYVAGSDLTVPVANGGTTVAPAVDFDIVVGTGVESRDVTIAYFDAVSGAAPIACAGTSTQADATAIVAPTDAGVVLLDQPLPVPGTNCMTITVADSVSSAVGTYVIEHRTQTMVPVFIDPPGSVIWTAADDSDSDPTTGFNRSIEVGLTPDSDVDGTLEIELVGPPTIPLGTAAVAPGTSSIIFDDLGLPIGVNQIQARWTDSFGLTASTAPLDIDVQIPGPSIAVSDPLTGDVVSNFTLQVVIEHLGGPEPVACQVYVDVFTIGSEVAVASWIPATSSLTFDATAMPDLGEGDHELRVQCTDGEAPTPNAVWYAVGTITVDDTPPVDPAYVDEPVGAPGRVVYVDGAFVNAQTPMSGGGTRHPVTLAVDGSLESLDGFRLELVSTAPGDAAETQTRCLWEGPPGVPDPTCIATAIVAGQLQDVLFPTVNFGSAPEGPLVLAARLIDRAGNPSGTVTVTLQKDTAGPVITQMVPDPGVTVLTEAEDADPGTPQVDVAFQYSVSGGVLGADCLTDPTHCLRLQIAPAPVNLPSGIAELPVTAAPVVFQLLTFADNLVNQYAATVSTTDAAGNTASAVYNFDVQAVQARLEWSNPAVGGVLNASFLGTFTVHGAGFLVNTPVVLCSTVLPASIPALTPGACDPESDPGCPCRLGSDGTPGGPDAGFVIGAATLTGTLTDSGADITPSDLAEGAQAMHFEAAEDDGDPDLASPFLTFDVDRTGPVVTRFTLDLNALGNDGTNIRLGAAEGTVSGTDLMTPVTVEATESAAGQDVEVYRGAQLVGSSTLDAALSATFDIALPAGDDGVLSVRVFDTAGNESDGTPILTVDVDFTAPTVGIAPAGQVFTSLDGTPDDAGTPDRSDDTLPIDVVVSFSDANIDGAALVLQAFDAVIGGAPLGAPVGSTLTTGQSIESLPLPLVAGNNFLEATVTDVFGNVGSSIVGGARESYGADFYGPLLTLSLRNGAGALQSCGADEATACLLDTLAPSGGRTLLDRTGADPYCPAAPFDAECLAAGSPGSDLRITLTECANSALEDCATNPAQVRLQSALGTGAFNPVFGGLFSAAGDISPDEGIYDQAGAGAYAFDAGITRQARLRAVDQFGNESFSNVLWVKLNQGGIVPDVTLIDVSLLPFSPSVNLADVDGNGEIYLGSRVNVSGSTSAFVMHLRVDLPVVVPGQDPTRVELTCAPSACRPGEFTISESGIQGVAPNFFVEILDVRASLSAPDAEVPSAFDFAVFCGASLCGERDYSGVHADVAPPRYQFDRCSLCNLGVAYAGAAANCSTCASDALNSSTDIMAGDTLWNHKGDQNPGSATTYSITGSLPLVVRVRGLDDGQDVTVASSQGVGISGNSKLGVTGCGHATSFDCNGGATQTACEAAGCRWVVPPIPASPGCDPGCDVTFDSMEVSSLAANGSRHILTLNFTDKAGNAAVPADIHCSGDICDLCSGDTCDPAVWPAALAHNEKITALVDTVRPEQVSTVACIGESTVPFDSTPANTLEDPACASYCATTSTCDRRAGEVTLRFDAPSDDGDGAGTLTAYEVLVAARSGVGMPITYLGCDDGTPCDIDPDCFGIGSGLCTPASHTTCNTVVPGAKVERTIALGDTPQAPGSEEIVSIDGLYPHRDYCFAVVGVDDAGNRANVTTAQVNRLLPLRTDIPNITGPQLTTFNSTTPQDDQVAAALRTTGGYTVRDIGDMDGDGRGDFVVIVGNPFALNSSADVYLSNGPNLGSPRPLTTPVTLNALPGLGLGVTAGDFDADGLSDLALCGVKSNFSGGVYIYYGQPGVGIDTTRVNSPVDPDLPNLIPDVAIVGSAANQFFCNTLLLADVDGTPNSSAARSADLMVGPLGIGSPVNVVLGYRGGGRARFSPGVGNPPVKVTLDLTVGSNWDPTTETFVPSPFPARTDFTIAARSVPGASSSFPSALAAADVSGDGILDLAVSDIGSNHGAGAPACEGAGEVYVYRGGSLFGAMAAPDTLAAGAPPNALLHILRFDVGSGNTGFGVTLARIPAPVSGDAADWLWAKSGNERGMVFKGNAAAGGIVPRSADILDPRVYPACGGTDPDPAPDLDLNDFWLLDHTLWNGSASGPNQFGTDIAVLGEWDGSAGVDLAVANADPNTLVDRYVFIFSFSEANHLAGGPGFLRSVILRGGQPEFGQSVAPIDDYFGAGMQLLVSSYNNGGTGDRVFVFR